MISEQLPILIIALPLMVSFVIPVIGWWFERTAYPLTLAAIGVSCLSSIALAGQIFVDGPVAYRMGGWPPPWGIEIAVDALNGFMIVLVSAIALLQAVYAKASIAKERPGKEVNFYCVYLLLYVGLMGMLVTGDMFNLYVFLEISSLTAYALIAIGDDKAVFAAFRYVVAGTIGACFYLLGVGYLYIVTGTLNMHDLTQQLPQLVDSNVILVASIFFVVGMGIKMGLFPLHTWLPGAYTHAPSAVSAYIAPLMTKVAAYVIIRVMLTVFDPGYTFDTLPLGELLGWTSAVAIVYGSLMAIAQRDFKRMLAYSSISQIGYIVLGLTLANAEGFTGSLLHIINHALMKGCLFAVAGAIIYRQGTRTIEDFGLLHRRMPLTAAAFAVAALSMIGIPPTAGFFSKWYLILGAITAEQYTFVVVILLSSLLNAVYFFKVVEHIYLKPQREAARHAAYSTPINRQEAPGSMMVPILILATGILIIGLASHWLVDGFLSRAIPASFL